MTFIEALHTDHKARLARMIKPTPKKARKPKPVLGSIDPAPYYRQMWFWQLLDVPVSRSGYKPTIRRIQEVVARQYHTSVAHIVSKKMTKELVLPRHVAMFIAFELTPHSLPGLAKHFGSRHHTTVLHGIRKIGALCKADQDMAETIEKLQYEIKSI